MWLLVLWLVFLLAVPLWTWSKIDSVDAAPSGDRPGDTAGTNYLIIGSDKADDLSPAQRKALKTGPRGGTNTDTIIVLHTGAGDDTMMSIPRDTLAEIPDHGTGMINSAFARGGAPLLVATVEKLTGLHIDHAVEPWLRFGDQHRRCPWWRGDLSQDRYERPDGAPRHQEGVPGGRRDDRVGVLAFASRHRIE